MTTRDAPAVFTSRVNLVPVTVVVRDHRGHAVGNLTKEDFRLLDNNKPQEITKFSIEKPDTPVVLEKETPEPGEPPQAPGTTPIIATRFVAYLFDDINTSIGDLAQARDAASRQLGTGLQPADRVAIYTTSGQNMLEFTDDQAKLQQTLMRLQSRSKAAAAAMDCPLISYYMADLIENRNDSQAMSAAVAEAYGCANLDPTRTPVLVVQSMIHASARRAMIQGDEDSRMALRVLGDVVRRISAMPGQRSVVLASPGFLLPFLQQELTEVINRAIRASVIVNCLDVRGLWAPPGFSAADPTPAGGPEVIAVKGNYALSEAIAHGDVLAELAGGTGGTFFHNNNDLASGFRAIAAAPEFIYVLGFTPSSLKADGKFHSLKVSLRESSGFTLQARRGYYAPRHETDAAEQAKQDIQTAVFSREVIREIPVRLHTQFLKSNEVDAKLSVLAQVDLKQLRYRKENGRNRDTVTVVSALFDPGGNFVAGITKEIEFRLLD